MSVEEIDANFARAIRMLEGKALEGCRAAAEQIAADAMPLTPIFTGKLRKSQRVIDNGSRRRPKAAVIYTDPKAPRVHQQVYRYEVGGAHFLQRAVDADAAEVPRIVASKMKF